MSLFDSDGQTFGPFGSRVWDMYSKIRDLVDREMMEFTEEELHMINLLYGENFNYPIYNHVSQLLTGAPDDEVLH